MQEPAALQTRGKDAGVVMEVERRGHGGELGLVTERKLAWSENGKFNISTRYGPTRKPSTIEESWNGAWSGHGTGLGLVAERSL